MVPVKPRMDGAERPFELLPAIDLRGGHVVRLQEGDFARETIYDDDPPSVARGFGDAGATWLHVVDLDGARDGKPRQLAVVAAIVAAVGGRVQVQVGGGLRDERSIATALESGAARVVIGTAALSERDFAGRLVGRHGAGRIVVALDVRGGQAVGEGWRSEAAGSPVADALIRLADEGVETVAVTAIERDGLLEGPDLELLGRLVDLGRARIIASGGIGSTEDVLRVRELGCAGAIVGRALYEGRIDLRRTIEALAADSSDSGQTAD